MNYYNIAADFKKETIDGYARLNSMYEDSKVIETYGQITVGNICESGRVYNDIPKIDIKVLKEYIVYSRLKGIDFNYCLNGSCMGNKEFTDEGAKSIIKFLHQLYDAGVRRLTVALPSLIELIKSTGLDFEIKVSIICQINSANKALVYKKIGVDRIVVDESLNRDFESLKRIRNAFGEKVEVIINSLCIKDCTYRMFHYNQTGHDSVDKLTSSIITFYNHKCMLRRAEKVENMLKLCWIRPEDIKLYSNIGINYYKIQGRHTAIKGDPVRAVECYFKQSYDGNLIDLLELFNSPYNFKIYIDNKKLDGYINSFFNIPNFCKNDCLNCKYCELYAKKCTEYEKANEINALATKFYKEYDEYTNEINTICKNREYDELSNIKLVDSDRLSFDLD